MPHIKIVMTHTRPIGNDDYAEYQRYIARDITDWEEVSEADLTFLKKHKHYLNQQLKPGEYGSDVLILELDSVPVQVRISALKEELKEQLAKEEADKVKRQEQLARRKMEKEKQKAALEKKTLADLAKKYNLVPAK